ncbi:M20/M25/M40 family metallo-hydrolase [Sphingomonas sp. HITSZ_GF]|uniref:M20/M25/M40 family metallo-hydrolase n=1 Tax=Sphingomonas sp. HITSZ_GF TaxID=3037247 RepID=UPI00240CE9AA|nr:M20/M25/M40 family metallo-hydrolase [Sphingomonas sp. HITSZ_GF]MDG2534534.1 M20/M25/M40 family metallo-hydrolase [Sphingomonas sp. HITSZ_GF]
MKRALLLAATLLAATPALAQDLGKDEAALKAHVQFLASDAMKGRDTGSPELTIAEQYVAAQMLAAGLKPAGVGGGWLQPVPLVAYKSADHGSLSFTRGGVETALVWGKDYVARAVPSNPKVAVSGPVVFAGYGSEGEYKGLNARGAIVAVLRDSPHDQPSDIRAHSSQPDQQAAVAARHGAIGVILIEGNARHAIFPFAASVGYAQSESMTWQGSDAGAGAPPFAYIGFDGAARLFAGSKIRWDAVLAADKADRKLPTGPLGATVTGTANTAIRTLTANNVAGVLPGTDKAGEYVVISAHLDHVGVGRPDAKGDTIYNGAMDNAVGTASMLEVAKRFQAAGKAPRRSILFVAVTAEEKGLVGSEYFAANPTVPKGSIVADVNLDMPILTYDFVDLVAYGADRSTVGRIVEQAAAAEGVKLVPDPAPEEASFVRSDHYSFVKAGIPAVSLDLGPGGAGAAASKEFLDKHYHQPSDEIGLIDWKQGLRFVGLNYAIARAIADAEDRPVWNKGDFFGTLYKGPMAK